MTVNKEEHGTQRGKSPHRYYHVALRCLQQGDAGLWHSLSHRWEWGGVKWRMDINCAPFVSFAGGP